MADHPTASPLYYNKQIVRPLQPSESLVKVRLVPAITTPCLMRRYHGPACHELALACAGDGPLEGDSATGSGVSCTPWEPTLRWPSCALIMKLIGRSAAANSTSSHPLSTPLLLITANPVDRANTISPWLPMQMRLGISRSSHDPTQRSGMKKCRTKESSTTLLPFWKHGVIHSYEATQWSTV